MNVSRRSLFTAVFAAPLAKLFVPVLRRINPVPPLGPGWMPLSEFVKTTEAMKALEAKSFGVWSGTVWSESLIAEANKKTFASQLFGDASSVIVIQKEHEE
jgi:hypothetical protein